MIASESRLELFFGGYGKLPTQGDFLRVPAHVHEIDALDRWIQGAMIYARHALGQHYQPLYEDQLYHRFVFRGEKGQFTILGVMRGASDAHQRLYPFVSYALISRNLLDQYPSLLTALLDVLYPELESRIGWALEQSTAEDIIAMMSNPAALALNMEANALRYMNFLQDWEVEDVGCNGGLHGRSVLEELLVGIEAARTTGRKLTNALALPLSAELHTQSLELRFWLELYLLGFQYRQLLPTSFSLFWPADPKASPLPMLHLTSRPPTEPLFASMLSPGAGQATVWTPGLGPNPFHTGRNSGTGIPMGTRLMDVLRALAPHYPSPCTWI